LSARGARSGAIDVAIVWGPFAGYFASRQPVDLDLAPVSPAVDPPGLLFAYDVSIGVKRGTMR
jgi:mxaJ protein